MYISILFSSVTLASTALAQSSTMSMMPSMMSSMMPSMSMAASATMDSAAAMSMMSSMSMAASATMDSAAAMSMASGTTSSLSSTASTPLYVIKVSNKKGDLTFSPNNMSAPVGSMVQFQFYPKNHSVVQAAFSDPCTPMSQMMSNMTGFKSGFMPMMDNSSMMPGFTIPIKDDKPIWYYCSQKAPVNHCGMGMVGVINPPADSTGKTIDTFMAAAMMMGGGAGNSTASSSDSMGSAASGSSSGSASGTGATGNAGSSTGTAAPSPSGAAFAGSANSLVVMGWSAFVGVGLALLM